MLTLYRIKVTADINQQNAEVQSGKIAFLTCLEAVLGMTNACLPTMKPVLNKMGRVGKLASLSIWTSSRVTGEPDSNPEKARNYSYPSSGRSHNWPKISKPRRIMERSSDLMFSYESMIDAPSLPSSSHRRVPDFHLPEVNFEKCSFDVGRAYSIAANRVMINDPRSSQQQV